MPPDFAILGGDFRGASVFQGSNVYLLVGAPAPSPAEERRQAEALLESLPLDEVPEPAALPSGSFIQHRWNPLFVGRRDDLLALARTLKVNGAAAIGQTAAATGLGGVGKTQLAVEFAHRYGRFFAGGVFFLSFADPATVPAEVARCASALGLAAEAGLEERTAAVLRLWQSDLPRLLVFDNCEDEELLARWRPPTGAASILVTSRRGDWSPASGVACLALGVLAPEESLELLLRFRPDLAARRDELAGVAAELGHLPLALHMAGSYLRRYRHATAGEPAAYLAALRAPDLLTHRSLTEADGTSPTGHALHVARSFALSLDRLYRAAPADALALALLQRAACFAPGEPIPRDLLAACVAESEGDGTAVEDAFRRLGELGLIEEEADGALKLHRLLAKFVLAAADAAARDAARDAVEATLAGRASAANESGLPAALLSWQLHLRTVGDVAEARGSPHGSLLLNELGSHLHMVASYAEARTAYERALAIDEKAFGPDHPYVAIRLSNLGGVLRAQADLVGARAAFERALAIDEKALGPDHPNTATRVNNLGELLHAQGDFAGARAALQRALAIDEKTLGPDHTNVATDLSNLGSLLHDLGDLPGARGMLERALAIDEKAFGADHPNVARRLNNLAILLQDLGDLAGVKAAYERALAIAEEAFGADHPHVGTCVNNVGDVLRAQGDFMGARAAFERALAIAEKTFGPNHPQVATCVSNLGGALHGQGDFAGARHAFERALAIDEKAYRAGHPKVAHRVYNLGRVLHDSGDLAGARAAFERALAVFERALGDEHPYTRNARKSLASLR